MILAYLTTMGSLQFRRLCRHAAWLSLMCSGLLHAVVLNYPYPEEDPSKKTYYSSFNEQPKTLDPARAYSANEYLFVAQIYEPPLQYDYYKRPYELIPLTAVSLPSIRYLSADFNEVGADSPAVAYSVYTLTIKPGIRFQPHPAFAKTSNQQPYYHDLSADYLSEHSISAIADFKVLGTRELVADDYIYQIKRLACPNVSSPVFGLMSERILGFKEFNQQLPTQTGLSTQLPWIDLRRYSLQGVKKIDKHTFEIIIKGVYPQFVFWLAMPFFAPVPWEADRFYTEPGMKSNNLTFSWFPVGTGPFMLQENNPNRRIMLVKNPNFRQEWFPVGGTPQEIKRGYAHGVNQTIPFIDRAVYTLEKESIPRWNKFLQGYYDLSGISTDSFNQAIKINAQGHPVLSDNMLSKKIKLTKSVDPSVYYLGFNLLDPVVGGSSERARLLRQAISIAINYEEQINLFLNGRGRVAHGPIPPGIYGYQQGAKGINPYVYYWQEGRAKRYGLDKARKLLSLAGYKNGIDPKTHRALILHYDVPASGGPDDKAALEWMRKQFTQIGIDLDIRSTLYNRFQEKMRLGNAQLFAWAWSADYPDPENFLFLLYGGNGKVKFGGENASNYSNPTYDRLFNQMKNLPNSDKRQKIIDQMVEIVRHDAPWVWGVNTETLNLSHQWVSIAKPNTMVSSQLKYMNINSEQRAKLQRQWNQARLFPLVILLMIITLTLLPLIVFFRKKEQRKASRMRL